MPRAATPVFADAALGVLETRQTRQRIDTILATPEMQHAFGEFGAGIARGVEDNIAGRDFRPMARTLGATTTDAVLQAAATEFPKTIGPEVQKVITDGIDQGLRDATQHDLGPALALTADVVALLKEQLQGDPQSHSPAHRRQGSQNGVQHV